MSKSPNPRIPRMPWNHRNLTVGLVLCLGGASLLGGCDRDAASSAGVTTAKAASAEKTLPEPAAAETEIDPELRSRQPVEKDATPGRPEVSRDRADVSAQPHLVIAEPDMLDLGKIPIHETGSGTVKLVNTGDRPMRIVGSRTSCGCTVANVPQGHEIAPGESVEVGVSLSGGARPTSLSKTVTFLVDGQPPLTMTVKGESVAFATIEPNIINPDRETDGRVVIRSMDGEPFSITAVEPRIAEFGPNAATEHELYLSWDAWRELNQPARLIVRLDHPHVSTLTAQLYSPPPRRDPNEPHNPLTANRANPRPIVANPHDLIQQNRGQEVLSRLAEDLDANTIDANGMPLLSFAVRHGNAEVVEALINAGADVNRPDTNGRTALMWAGHARNDEIVRLLLEGGAEVNARDSNTRSTALAWTAMVGDAASVRRLIDAGADVEAQSATGSPLIWASGYGEAATIELLVKAGANIEAADPAWNQTPIMHAARSGRVENVKVLAKAGANLESRDAAGRTALLVAASSTGSNAAAIKSLLEAGADVTAKDNSGRTALDHARRRTDSRAADVVALLESAE